MFDLPKALDLPSLEIHEGSHASWLTGEPPCQGGSDLSCDVERAWTSVGAGTNESMPDDVQTFGAKALQWSDDGFGWTVTPRSVCPFLSCFIHVCCGH